jgi:hypothetical protein
MMATPQRQILIKPPDALMKRVFQRIPHTNRRGEEKSLNHG